MSSDLYCGKSAEKYMTYYISGKIAEYKQLMAEGGSDNEKAAYFALGMAMHAAMDSTSPLHEGFQKFSLNDVAGLAKGSLHLFGGEGEKVFKSDINHMKGVMLIRRLFDEANR